MAAGRLIVFEGPEGAGKSTQIRMLAERLTRAGVPHIAVREPGGTPLGDQIRRLLLEPGGGMHPSAEALLFMASRAELVREVIGPALAEGKVVIMDRFFLSTYAYQIHGRRLPKADIRAANHLATGGLTPDLTFVLSVPAPAGLARATRRSSADRIESTGDDFHDRVAGFFARLADPEARAMHPEAGELVVVDGLEAPERVAGAVAEELARRWPETFPAASESHH